MENKIFELLKGKLSEKEIAELKILFQKDEGVRFEKSAQQVIIDYGRSNMKNRFKKLSELRNDAALLGRTASIAEIKSLTYQKAAFMNPSEIHTDPLPIDQETIREFLGEEDD
ncbi:MAG: hypothetical protein U9N86_00825 [Bacteroidota bacterium]|nr:hypothetical protein [Bacteroidota bacterium]